MENIPKKNPQHNICTDSPTKRRKDKQREINNELLLYRDWPITEEHALKMIEDLFLFMQDKKTISVVPWREKHGLSEKKVWELRQKYPKFAEHYDEIKERIAWRRIDLAAERKHDPNITRYVMPYFSQTFKDIETWRAGLKAAVEESKRPQITVVEMPTFPSSDKVPVKGEDV